MTTIVTRASNGAPLTNTQMDTNLTNLNNDKVETSVMPNYALLASPTFTGVPKAPTATPGTATTQLATTAFVQTASTGYVLKSGDTLTGPLWAAQGQSFQTHASPNGGSAVGNIQYLPDMTTVAGGSGTFFNAGVAQYSYMGVGTTPWINGLQVDTSGRARQTGVQGTEAGSLTRKDYVDTKLPLTGGTLTGGLGVNAPGQSLVTMMYNGSIMGHLSATSGQMELLDAGGNGRLSLNSSTGEITLNTTVAMPQGSGTDSNPITFYALGYGFVSALSGTHVAGEWVGLTVNVTNNQFFTFRNNGYAYAPVGWTQGSDARFKENITPIPDALNKLQQISGNTFNRTDQDGKEFVGVIAQEVQAILPQGVSGYKDDLLAVDSMAVVALLVEAVKELSAKVAELEAKCA